MTYAIPLIFRYLSMVLQFVTFVFIARRLPSHDTGIYFEVFGFVNTTYFIAGLGLPDGLVRFVSHADASEERGQIRPLIARAAVLTALSSIAIVLIGYWCTNYDLQLRLWVAAWWLCYAVVFFGSQVLVSVGQTSLGAFYFYPATSIALFAASVPYLVFSHSPNIKGTLEATCLGALICAVAVFISVVAAYFQFPASNQKISLWPVLRLGFFIGVGRVLQTSLYWIPVWGVGWALGAGHAGEIGTASRLNAAVAAVMAAIRFTIRPSIVRSAAKGDWNAIARESREVATLATLSTLIAMAVTFFAGSWIVSLIFGKGFGNAGGVLTILLIGTMGECIGGPVDEILKMTGRAHITMNAQIVAALVEGALVLLLAHHGILAIASAQAITFVSLYAFMLWTVYRSQKLYVGANLTALHLRGLLARTFGKEKHA